MLSSKPAFWITEKTGGTNGLRKFTDAWLLMPTTSKTAYTTSNKANEMPEILHTTQVPSQQRVGRLIKEGIDQGGLAHQKPIYKTH